jgi:tRNA threonylcarbamoyladenosine biosynthesis protein TsaE
VPTDPTVQLTVATPDDMAALGALLAGQLRAGDLVTLNGELGAGKTTLTRGLGEALGVRGAVTSPTFVLARTHPRDPDLLYTADGAGNVDNSADPARDLAPLVHVDAYRLSSAAELDDLDIDFARSIVVVEWGAGLLDGITDEWLSLDIVRPTGALVRDAADSTSAGAPDLPADDVIEPRTITVTAHGERWKDLGWIGAARN